MRIREVDRTDIRELSALAVRTFTDAFGDSMSASDLETVVRETRSESYFKHILDVDTILIAEEHGKIIGYIQFGDVKTPEVAVTDEGDRELLRIYVDTRHYRKGIGSKLMEAALKHRVLKNAMRVYLSVWDQNEKALGLYRKFGFTTRGAHDVKIGDRVIGTNLILVRQNSHESHGRIR